MRHIWSILCTKSVIDKASNNVSLFEIIEEIHLPPEIREVEQKNIEAIAAMPFDWVTLWVRSKVDEPESGNVKDMIVSPSGKIIVVKEYGVELYKHKRSRITRRIPMPPSNKTGVYGFRTYVKDERRNIWRKVAEVPLEVIADKVQGETG